jgi:hypothetical protein
MWEATIVVSLCWIKVFRGSKGIRSYDYPGENRNFRTFMAYSGAEEVIWQEGSVNVLLVRLRFSSEWRRCVVTYGFP